MAALVVGTPSVIAADDKAEINRDSQAALTALYGTVPAAKQLAAKATAILVFPKITKAGLGIGGQGGEGALIKGGTPVASESAYEIPRRLGTPSAVAEAALQLERRSASTYAWLVANTVGGQRRWAIDALTDTAVRELSYRGSPEIFPGADESTDRG